MKKKSLKKTMVIALAGIMLAGSLGWSQIPSRAAVNGEVICAHENAQSRGETYEYDGCGFRGHLVTINYRWYCPDCRIYFTDSIVGNLESHDFSDHWCIEDLGGGMYMHRIRCVKCEYMDEVLSDDPSDPKV